MSLTGPSAAAVRGVTVERPAEATPRASLWPILAPVLAAQALLTALVCLRVGPLGWDDGAITLAYSRTFASTGQIAITPQSEQVEGFSSVAWFLINSLIARTGLGFDGLVAAAQALAGITFMAATGLMALIGRRLALRPGSLTAILWIFAFSGPALAEMGAGMEMGLLCFSGLALVQALYFRPAWIPAMLSAVVFLTARYEAALYFAVLLAPLLLRRRYTAFLLMAGFGGAVFAAEEAWRWTLFADWAPNTVHAKMWLPYSGGGLGYSVLARALGLMEPAAAAAALLAITAVLAMGRSGTWTQSKLPAAASALWVIAAPILAAEIFGLVVGHNIFGDVGRMQLFALPFVLFGAALAFDALTAHLPGARRRLILGLAAVISIETSAVISAPLVLTALNMPRPLGDDLGVTAANYRITGVAVEGLRRSLGLGRIVFMTPDIGGVGLCCERIRVVDLALLANRRLAHGGYGAIDEVLASERPDVVQAHEVWAAGSGLLSRPAFEADYTPLMAGRTRLYIRNDHARALVAKGLAEPCPVASADCRQKALVDHRGQFPPPFGPADDLAFLRSGEFLILTGPEASGR